MKKIQPPLWSHSSPGDQDSHNFLNVLHTIIFSLVNYEINKKLHDDIKTHYKTVPDSHVDCHLPGNGMPSAVSDLVLKVGLSGSRARQPVGRETHFAVRGHPLILFKFQCDVGN